MDAVLRAYFGYMFLVLMVRVVGRRPGKQLTPFEYVLIFFMGGLALSGVVGDERSLTNAICQILAIASAHYTLSWARAKSPRFARLVDGTPLVLLEQKHWRAGTLKRMHIEQQDVMFAARDHGLKTFDEVGTAILERNGDISVLPVKS
jgi:uncharacterized membrane protein YcaP (DUF421 family)